LHTKRLEAENEAVRAWIQVAIRSAALSITMLGVCFTGIAHSQDRDGNGISKTSDNAPPPEDRIDINHASLDELSKVPGMTRSWAGRIIRFRPYRTKQDIVERGVVPNQVYDRIKDYVIAHRKPQ
jgi:DNA uptake protein ComE-like DNA-binding protein